MESLGNIYVGNEGDGTLRIDGATVVAQAAYVGSAAGSNGEAALSGGTWINNGGFYVGNQGSGTVSASSEAVINTGGGYVGYAAGVSGEIRLDDSTWKNLSTIVGYQGKGLLDIRHGSFMRTNGTSGNSIGSQLGSEGDVHIVGLNANGDHSTWRVLAGNFYVGKQGSGLLEIADGGQLINEAGYGGNDSLEIGSATGSSGEVTVSGAGSILSAFGQIIVGGASTGNLDISDGAIVDSGSGLIGRDSGSTGVVSVDGAGSLWESPGKFYVGYSGSGLLHIASGGRVNNYGDHSYVGYNAGSSGEVTVDGAGSRWSLEIGLHVGTVGTGTLDITNGGIVESGKTTEIGGGNNSGVGTVNVNGVGSHFNVGGQGGPYQSLLLSIGRRGSGTLNITEGALATIVVADIGGSESSGDTGKGTVTVDGAGSRLEVSDVLIVGHRGEGTLAVTNGAYLQGSETIIGKNSGARGILTIEGAGSQAFFQGGPFTIGELGDGTFEILNGAQVTTSTQVQIGAASNLPLGVGNGAVIVDGPGSSWQNIGLYVGYRGHGTLEIRNGGHVSSQGGSIGRPFSQTSGIVTVDGPGSSGRTRAAYSSKAMPELPPCISWAEDPSATP